MSEFVTFAGDLLSIVSEFLLSEPIIWFVGVFLLAAVAGCFFKIVNF